MRPIVIYYSLSGNTRAVAELLKERLGCEAVALQTEKRYPKDYDAVVEEGKREVEGGETPRLLPLSVDLAPYDTVLIGTPVWWYTYAPAVKSFLAGVDLAGKRVFPFLTSGGWPGHTARDFAAGLPGARVEKALSVRFDDAKRLTPDREIAAWADAVKNAE